MQRLFLNALIFGLAPLLQRLAGLILLPLYTHYLSGYEYGRIEWLSIGTGLIGIFVRLELRAGFLRAWIAGDAAARGALLRRVLSLMVLTGSLGATITIGAGGWVAPHIFGAPLDWPLRLALAAGVLADGVLSIAQAALQAQMASRRLSAASFLQFLISASITALGVVHFHWGAFAFFAGGAAASAAILPLILLWLRPALMASGAAPPMLLPLLRFSWPLLIGAGLFFIVRNTDRLAVGGLMSTADLGIYAMAWTLANLLATLVFQPLLTAYEVWRHEVWQAGGDGQILARFLRVAMLLLGLAAIALAGFGADLFAAVADPRFAQSLRYLPLLSVAIMLQAGYSFINAPFYATGATRQWLLIFAGGAGAQILLSLFLVPKWGLMGAACAMIGANLVLYAGAAWLGPRLWPIVWPHRGVAVMVLSALLCALARAAAGPAGPVWAFGLDAAACLLFLALCGAGGQLTRQDFVAARGVAGAWVRRKWPSLGIRRSPGQ